MTVQPAVAQKNAYSLSQQEKVTAAQKLLAAGIAQKDSIKISDAYYTLGRMDMETRNYLASTQWLMKGISIREKYGDSDKLGRFYLRLNDNELAQNHYQAAFRHTRKVISIFLNAKSEQGLAIAYSQMGATFFSVYSKKIEQHPKIQQSNYDSAIYYFDKTKSLFQKLKDTLGLAYNFMHMGSIAITQKDPKAIAYYLAASDFYEKLGKKTDKLYSLVILAYAYLSFKKPQKAFSYIKEAEKYRKETHIIDYGIEKKFEELYIKYAEATGNWQAAYQHLQRLSQLEKKELMADSEGAVSRLQIEYETEKKEVQLEKQKLSLQLKDETLGIQQLFLWIVVTLLCLAVLLSYVLFRLYKKNQKISHRNAILIQEQNHRVKNNLQVISSLLSLQANGLEDPKAKQAVDESQLRIETMAILHQQLYDTEQLDTIDMEDFVAELSATIFQSFGFTDVKTNYEISIHAMPADKAIFFGLVLNELISNACKYAFLNHDSPALSITLTENDQEIMLKVKDNGQVKIKDSTIAHSKSFGLKLINMMASQLNGTVDYRFEKGTEITFKCP